MKMEFKNPNLSLLKKKFKMKMGIISMEELAELQQAISKKLRGRKDLDNLAEEIADSLICIDYYINTYNLENSINKHLKKKIDRMSYRLKHNKF